MENKNSNKLTFNIGDVIVAKYIYHSEWPERRIIGFDGKNGYFWEYPGIPASEANKFSSLASNDPKLELWILKVY